MRAERERVGRGPVSAQVPDPLLGFDSARDRAKRDPPQGRVGLGHLLEPLAAATQDLAVDVGVDERGQRLGRLPHRHVHDDTGTAGRVPFEGPHGGGVAVLGLQPPHEAGRGIRGRVDRIERGREVSQRRAGQRRAQPGNIDLRQHVTHPPILPQTSRRGPLQQQGNNSHALPMRQMRAFSVYCGYE